MTWVEALAKSGKYSADLVVYVFVAIIVTYVSFWLYKRQQKINILNQLPGPKTFPFIGNGLDFFVCYGKPAEYLTIIRNNLCVYSCGMTRLWMLNVPACVIYKANNVEVILSSQKHIDKSIDYATLHPWLGTGLLTSTGAKWQHRRKMLTPSFHFKILEDFIEVFNQQSSIFISILKEKSDGTPFNIFNRITRCTLDIILETAMGRSINAQGNADSDYVKAVYKIGALIIQRQLRPWLRPYIFFKLSGFAKEHDDCLKILHSFSNKIINERRIQYQSMKSQNKSKEDDEVFGKRKRLAFLDLLLDMEDGDTPLSDNDIREEVDTFMFEGHDTTAAAINWSIYLLGSYPEIQKKVHEELDAIFGNSDRPATSADLREMKYLECCIKETLRLFPSVPFIGRQIHEDVQVEGYTIPSGTNVYIMKYCLHRDPEYFPDPDEFQPERFFPENCANRHPYAYIPFSAGPRNCIGQKFAMMEEKVVLSSFFRKYRVESLEKREELQMTLDIILRPKEGTMVKIYHRNK